MSKRRARAREASVGSKETSDDTTNYAGMAWAEGWGNGYTHSGYANRYPEGSAAATAWEKGTEEGRAARRVADAKTYGASPRAQRDEPISSFRKDYVYGPRSEPRRGEPFDEVFGNHGYRPKFVDQEPRRAPRSEDAKLLGVDDDCSDDTLRDAYRSAVFANHPDRGGSEARMKEINLAFDRMKRARGGQ